MHVLALETERWINVCEDANIFVSYCVGNSYVSVLIKYGSDTLRWVHSKCDGLGPISL